MNLITGKLDGNGKRIGIVASRFNEPVTKKLLEGALETLRSYQVQEDHIVVVWVPGAFEVPFAAKKLARQNCFDAIICLGAVIRGETPHFDYVAGEATKGIAQISLELEIPIIFGILTTDTIAQAIERLGNGSYAAKAALEVADLAAQIDSLALQSYCSVS